MLKNIGTKVMNKANMMVCRTARKCGGKEIIMEFAIGAIAIALAILFKEQLSTLISTVSTSFTSKIQAIFSSL